MIVQEMGQQDFEKVGRFTSPARDGLWFWVSLDVRNEARAAAPSRTHEDAAIEAEDVLSQADEALVMG